MRIPFPNFFAVACQHITKFWPVKCEWKWKVPLHVVPKGWDILSPSHSPNSCMKTRCLESRPGNSDLELHGYWLFLKGRNPRDGNQQDRRSLGFWLLLRKHLSGSLDSYMKEKKNLPSSLKSLLAWVSVTNSFIYVLINSKGNRNQWMKTIHAQMENPQYKPYFTSQNFFNSERLPQLLKMEYHACKYSLA